MQGAGRFSLMWPLLVAVLLPVASLVVLAVRCEAFCCRLGFGLGAMLLADQKEKKAVSRQKKER